jgi:hypothetical protein
MWVKNGKYGTVQFYFKNEILSSIPICSEYDTMESVDKMLKQYTYDFIKTGLTMDKSIPQMIAEFSTCVAEFYEKRFILGKKTSEEDHCQFVFAMLSLIKFGVIENDDITGYQIFLKKKKKKKPKVCSCDYLVCKCFLPDTY